MVRPILGVIVGFIVTFILVSVLFVGAAVTLGGDGCFEKGTYNPTMAFNIFAVVASIVGALAGGWVCSKVGRNKAAVIALAAVFFCFGAYGAWVNFNRPEPGPRPEGISMIDVFKDHKGKEPNWFAIANPIIGALGVMLGGSCLGCCKMK